MYHWTLKLYNSSPSSDVNWYFCHSCAVLFVYFCSGCVVFVLLFSGCGFFSFELRSAVTRQNYFPVGLIKLFLILNLFHKK